MSDAIHVLANDGLSDDAIRVLENKGIRVDTHHLTEEQLAQAINNYDVLVVRSATRVPSSLIALMQRPRLIIRAGVGVDNIDLEAAQQKGITVKNTPRASASSVAELVFAHLFGMARFLFDANRQMPLIGHEQFNALKKKYADGQELQGKTLGLIGLGNIGQACARVALGIGMKVVAHDPYVSSASIVLNIGEVQVPVTITTTSKQEVLQQADFISLHVSGNQEVLTADDFALMKKGVGIINCARGGVFSESVLLQYLDSGKVAFAALDVFEHEPRPNPRVLAHPRISLSPHIGASTREAQQRIGMEVAELIIAFFNQ
ncbi:MAG: D-2-hydroxyacid dehydrogenase [Chitinophagales bacterium]|nr:D-2-hydroxyacid dehydrogenase [Chitinophagales bacterium]MDW8428424.1 D-2-hydroxyacid dehydrogenase [Chitinophagales bacterium]